MSLIDERISCPLGQWRGEPGRCQLCNALIESTRRRTWCSDKCGREWQRNHIWRFARSAAKRRAKYRCQRPGCTAERRDCEVNHIQARDGAGYGPGCHHHLNADKNGVGGLEVLCHAHHAEVTAAQAKARAEKRAQTKTRDTKRTQAKARDAKRAEAKAPAPRSNRLKGRPG